MQGRSSLLLTLIFEQFQIEQKQAGVTPSRRGAQLRAQIERTLNIVQEQMLRRLPLISHYHKTTETVTFEN